MFRKVLTTVFIFSLATTLIFSQTAKPKTAESILKKAKIESASTGKNIFVIFHASWCKWCKKLDTALESNDLKKLLEDKFVIVHLDVLERGTKIDSLENPGGKELMAKYGGEKSGLPFCVFLDKNGKMISNSNVMNKQNIGYPGTEEEIEAFTRLIKGAAKDLTEAQFIIIEDYLTKNAPKPGEHK